MNTVRNFLEALLVVCLCVASPAGADLIQHLDASVSESIVVDANNVLLEWLDLSGNDNHAVANVGFVFYPSTPLAGGLVGLDFGLEHNDLQLLDVNETSALLDFPGAAAGNSGFTVFVACRVDEIGEDQDVIGTKHTLDNFAIRIKEDGEMQARLDTQIDTDGELLAVAGDTIVFGFSYEAATGNYWFWESKNDVVRIGTGQDPNGDWDNNNTLRLGNARTTAKIDDFFMGAVGEVMIFDAYLSKFDLDWLRSDLHYKWAVTPEEKVHATVPSPADGVVDVAVSGVSLSWKPGLDRISEDLYFGTDMETVLSATPADPNTYMGSQVPRYALGDLEDGQTYYWRVETHSDAVYSSPVWSFTTVLPVDPNDPNAI